MKFILITFLKYYLPIVLVFSVIDYNDPDYRIDLPKETHDVERAISAVLESATLSSSTFKQSVHDMKESAGTSDELSDIGVIAYLFKIYVYGFVLFCILLIPMYLYAWIKQESRMFGTLYFDIMWNTPKFRDTTFLVLIITLALISLLSLKYYPIIGVLFFSLGGLSAIQKPILLNITLGIIDRYTIQPHPWIKAIFNKLELGDGSSNASQQLAAQNIVSPTTQKQTARNNKSTSTSSSSPKKNSRNKVNPVSDWQTRINRK